MLGPKGTDSCEQIGMFLPSHRLSMEIDTKQILM